MSGSNTPTTKVNTGGDETMHITEEYKECVIEEIISAAEEESSAPPPGQLLDGYDDIDMHYVERGPHGYGIYGFGERVEDPWEYLPGGHHPVHLGDTFYNYKVINKLGSGGFGTVWLCRVLEKDPTEYVALKIIRAMDSGEDNAELVNVRRLLKLAETDPDVEKYCLLPLDRFELEGVNGVHQCFVYPVAGQAVQEIWNNVNDPEEYLRSLTRQTVEAMAMFHRHGICHGDFRPSNILLRLDGLSGAPEEEVEDLLGPAETLEVIPFTNMDETAHPPGYLVKAVEFDGHFNARFASDKICVIDFGECFEISNPPERGAIPYEYASPELALADQCGTPSDIWALATSIFEIRTGYKLFSMEALNMYSAEKRHYKSREHPTTYAYWIINKAGLLPEPFWSKWSPKWRKWELRYGVPVEEIEERSLDHAQVRLETIREGTSRKVGHLLRPLRAKRGWRASLTDEERMLFEDLVFKMTDYDVSKRLTMEEVLRHPWLSYRVEGAPLVEAHATEPVHVNVLQPCGSGNDASFENSEIQSTTTSTLEAEDVDMAEAPTTVIPDPVDGLQRNGLEAGFSTGDIHQQSVEVSLPQSQESSPPAAQELSKFGPKLELNVVREGVFAVSTWLRTTVGKAFQSMIA